MLDPYNRFFTGLSTASLVALLGYNYRNETLDRHNKSLWVALGCSLLLRALPFVIDRINEPTVDTKTVEEVIDLDIEGLSVNNPFSLPGMKCKGCANAVHNALNSVDGVYQNSVSLDEKTAKVFVKGKKVTEQQVDDVLRPLGFRAKKAKQ